MRLDVPDAGTRPTSDRVRESLFGSLESMDAIDGARVLDLYAGSGALGLEAWSRGATRVDFVERGRTAAAAISRNIGMVAKSLGGLPAARVHQSPATRVHQSPAARVHQSPAARVHQSTVQSFLARTTGPYDLVFTDPPYDLDDAAMDADLAALAPLLAPDAVIVIERGKRAATPLFADAGLELLREKTYGDTRLWWATPAHPRDDGVQATVASQSR